MSSCLINGMYILCVCSPHLRLRVELFMVHCSLQTIYYLQSISRICRMHCRHIVCRLIFCLQRTSFDRTSRPTKIVIRSFLIVILYRRHINFIEIRYSGMATTSRCTVSIKYDMLSSIYVYTAGKSDVLFSGDRPISESLWIATRSCE